MRQLSELRNEKRPAKKPMRVGRGPGCKKGKTCGRGVKGDKARSGYKRRHTKEGGQVPLFQKLPTRGFTRGRFKKEMFAINLDLIENIFDDGESVNLETLTSKGFSKTKLKHGFKILGNGDLKKKVKIEANRISKSAMVKLEEQKIEFKLVK
jgi:large subunit ribosomal protein L15